MRVCMDDCASVLLSCAAALLCEHSRADDVNNALYPLHTSPRTFGRVMQREERCPLCREEILSYTKSDAIMREPTFVPSFRGQSVSRGPSWSATGWGDGEGGRPGAGARESDEGNEADDDRRRALERLRRSVLTERRTGKRWQALQVLVGLGVWGLTVWGISHLAGGGGGRRGV